MILNRKWTGAMVERLHHGSKGWRWEPHPLTVGVCDMPTSKKITLSSLWSQLAIVDNGVKGLINPILKMMYALVLVPCAHWLYWLFFHSCKVHSNKIWHQMDTISWTPELRSGESCIGYLDRLFALAVQILHSHCGGEISVSFLPCAQWAGWFPCSPSTRFPVPMQNVWLRPNEYIYTSVAQGQDTRIIFIYLYIDVKYDTHTWIWSSPVWRETVSQTLASSCTVEPPGNKTERLCSKHLTNIRELSLTTCIYVSITLN